MAELNTAQLNQVLSSNFFAGCGFGGVYASDKLPKHVPWGKRFYIANTDPANKPGQHWVAFFFNTNNTCVYFDSFGLPPLRASFIRFMEDNSERWIYSSKRLQHPSSKLCGYYCIFFIHLMCEGKTLRGVVKALSDDLKWNDRMVEDFVSHYHEIDMSPVQPSTYSQTCCIAKRCDYLFLQ